MNEILPNTEKIENDGKYSATATTNAVNDNNHNKSDASIRNSLYDNPLYSVKNSNSPSLSSSARRNNLVLSTSFVSTRRVDNISPSPTSPLTTRKPHSSISKTKQHLKGNIEHLENELYKLKKKKENTERVKNASISNIFTAAYSTEHIQQHSKRIKINTQIREMDKQMKKLETQINDLKDQYESINTLNNKNNDDRYEIENTLRSPTIDASGNNVTTPVKVADSFNHVSTGIDNNSMSHTRSRATTTSTTTTNNSGIVMLKTRKSFNSIDKLSLDQFRPVEKNKQDDLLRKITDESTNLPTDSTESLDIKNSNLSNDENNYLIENDTTSAAVESATWYISDYMESLQEKAVSTDFILEKANSLVDILNEHKELRKNLVLTTFLPTLQSLLLKDESLVSAAVYRICRYLINENEFIMDLLDIKIDIFLILSLAKDSVTCQIEREQALKLIRTLSGYKEGLTKGILQAVISCVEKTDDTFRTIAVETLLEFCFTHPQLVRDCHGIHVLEELLQNSTSFQLMSIILNTIFVLMEESTTRRFFLLDFDISVLISVFSDVNTKKSINIEKLHNASNLITIALKNYNGFMLFCANNFKPMKELLSFFQVPICAHYLIDIFLDVLRIKPLISKSKTKELIFKANSSELLSDATPINQTVSLIVQVFNKCNFHDYVSELVRYNLKEEFNSTVIMKARYLLAEFSNLRMNLLDSKNLAKFHTFPQNEKSLTEETFQFSKIIRNMNKNRNTIGLSDLNYIENIRSHVKSVRKTSLISSIDDLRLRKMVYDTKVLQTKDFTIWNWNIIQELLEGPLLNKKQFEELAKSTKFIRRLLVFYRPLRMRFSNVDKGSRLSRKYVQVGCEFFRLLTTNPEGMKILSDDTKIVPQLATLLFKAMEGNLSDNIFNEKTLQTKIISGYFKFIGILTQSINGIKILTRWNFFTVIYRMFQYDSDIGYKFLLLTLPELDFTYSSHCRTIIGKALVAPDESLRIVATKYVGDKLRDLLQNKTNHPNDIEIHKNLQTFKLELLTRQLYDLSPSVVAIADKALFECIVDKNVASELKATFKTFLNQMVFIRSPILFILMGKPYGFQLLNDINFVEQERKSWLEVKNKEYVKTVEEFLYNSKFSVKKTKEFDRKNRLPLHFYGSLAKTEGGITLLSQSGDFIKFINVIKKYITELSTGEYTVDIIDIKSILWCCGYIGSTELGIGLLDNYSAVEDIIEISYNAHITSIKFTAFYALGLISRTKEGCEILDEMGWNCTINVESVAMGIALPNKLDKFLSFQENSWIMEKEYKDDMIEYYLSNHDIVTEEKIVPIDYNLDILLTEKHNIENPLNEKTLLTPTKINPESTESLVNKTRRSSTISSIHIDTPMASLKKDDIVQKVLRTISQLGNHILSNNSIKLITEMNIKYGSTLFESDLMFYKVLEMMDTYRFRPHVRKFLFGIFINTKTLESVIKREKDNRKKN